MFGRTPYRLGVRQQVHLQHLAATAGTFHNCRPFIAILADEIDDVLCRSIRRIGDARAAVTPPDR